MDIDGAGGEYLKTILQIREEKGTVRSMDVVNRLRVSRPSVSRAVKHLHRDGYITVGQGKRLFLTEAGLEIAERTLERYSVLKEWLLRLGADPGTAERDACEMVRAISDESVGLLKKELETRTR